MGNPTGRHGRVSSEVTAEAWVQPRAWETGGTLAVTARPLSSLTFSRYHFCLPINGYSTEEDPRQICKPVPSSWALPTAGEDLLDNENWYSQNPALPPC